jgi:hypothetical protein
VRIIAQEQDDRSAVVTGLRNKGERLEVAHVPRGEDGELVQTSGEHAAIYQPSA